MQRKFFDNILIEAIKNIYALLDKNQRKKGGFIFILLFINAGIDVIGLGAIYPLIDAALNPELIQTSVYLKKIYDTIGVADSTSFMLILSCIVLGILILKNVTSIIITYLQTDYSHKVALDFNKKMFLYYYGQGFLFLKNEHSGKQLHNIKYAPKNFASEYFMRTLFGLNEIVVILLILIGLVVYNPLVILLFLFLVLPLFLVFYFIAKSKTKAIGAKIYSADIKGNALLLEGLKAYTEVKLYNKEKRILGQFMLAQKELLKYSVRERIYNGIPRHLYDIVLIFGVITILLATKLLGNTETAMASTLSIFALAAYRLIPAVGKLITSIMYIKTSADQVKPLLVLRDYEPANLTEVKRLPLHKEIAFQNISFSYVQEKASDILKNVSFKVKKGETIGFIGSSGSGKTTLIHLLLRLIREKQGHLTIDGKVLNLKDDAAFQKNIGYVQQDVYIKDGTLKENIAFIEVETEINRQRLNNVIQEAMLSDFVANHPDGLNMQLGENGVKLSGGQKQRIGIARALYKQADILVFDEITSALDMETESAIVKTIIKLSKTNKTIFIVAHRITTLSSCNRIYELENGEIKQAHKYKELFNQRMASNYA